MASRRIKAVALCMAVAFAPLSAGQAVASGALLQQGSTAQPDPAAVADVAKDIADAVAAAKADPTYAGKSNAAKAIALQQAVAGALSKSGATDAVVTAALNSAVASGAITATIAIQSAATVSPALVTAVASAPAVSQQMTQQGLTVSSVTTASTAQQANGAPSVLVSLASVSSTSTTTTTTTTGGTDANTTAPAPYDPCAGVIATYCGI